MRACLPAVLLLVLAGSLTARELHVSPSGSDAADGAALQPLRTISAAAARAQPGDTITVHAGVYRERVTPPRGGDSDQRRIVYQAAPGETVVIKGSEVIRGWTRFLGNVWKVAVPNAIFGRYHPYRDVLAGDWFTDRGRPHHTGEVYLNGKSLYEVHLLERVLNPQPYPESRDPEGSRWTWFCETDEQHTYLYANFHDQDPNAALVEINVRDSCFYPARPGCDYITVRGFRMCHAATQWAPPTAEQIGLLGTHWSKGWIIEHNVISDAKCSGVTLGKDRATGHNVWSNDRRKDGATHYNEVIERALQAGWSREKVGSHVVRHNVIFDCEQTGICGSLGAVFSRITDNHIYNIWTKRQFTGAEIGGIKLHAAIDVLIRRNRIHNAHRALWLDWMAQGTRVSGNLCYDNTAQDLFVEVNHGPYVVDNNVFLSAMSLLDWSEGGAFAHNLFAGSIVTQPEPSRVTPYHRPHSTSVAALRATKGGDDRFYNNLFVGSGEPPPPAVVGKDGRPSPRVTGHGPWVYDTREQPVAAAGNVYCRGARPSARETAALVLDRGDPRPRVVEEGSRVFVELTLDGDVRRAATAPVTTEMLGTTQVAQLPFEDVDATPLTIAIDFGGEPRDARRPTPGPFEKLRAGLNRFVGW